MATAGTRCSISIIHLCAFRPENGFLPFPSLVGEKIFDRIFTIPFLLFSKRKMFQQQNSHRGNDEPVREADRIRGERSHRRTRRSFGERVIEGTLLYICIIRLNRDQ